MPSTLYAFMGGKASPKEFSGLNEIRDPVVSNGKTISYALPARAQMVGSVGGVPIFHGLPGDQIPVGATVYADGRIPWTWEQVGKANPDVAANCIPHEYAGEPTAVGFTDKTFVRTRPLG